MSRSNANYWYAYEAIGTTRQLLNAQGQVTDSYAFDAWGNALATIGNTVNPHRYVGKYGYYLDTQSALMLLGVRYYVAGVGRFVSLDLIREGTNWYVYADPINTFDPEGTKPVKIDPTDEYCEAAKQGPRGGMRDANSCFCKVSRMVDELIKANTPRGLLANIFCYVSACNQWLRCMKDCIYQDWSQWWNTQQKNTQPKKQFKVLSPKRIKPIIPPGTPKPDDCWQGKLPIEINDRKRTIDEVCQIPQSMECCYAIVTCEKHSLFRYLSKCRNYQVVTVYTVVYTTECCWPIEFTMDCLSLLDYLTELAGVSYPYTGSLEEQIKASREICCESNWPYEK